MCLISGCHRPKRNWQQQEHTERMALWLVRYTCSGHLHLWGWKEHTRTDHLVSLAAVTLKILQRWWRKNSPAKRYIPPLRTYRAVGVHAACKCTWWLDCIDTPLSTILLWEKTQIASALVVSFMVPEESQWRTEEEGLYNWIDTWRTYWAVGIHTEDKCTVDPCQLPEGHGPE